MWHLVIIVLIHGRVLLAPGFDWEFPSLQECLADGGVRVSGWAEPGTHGAYTCARRGETAGYLRKVRRPRILF